MILNPIKNTLKALGLYNRVATAYHPFKVWGLRRLNRYHVPFQIAPGVTYNIDKAEVEIYIHFVRKPLLAEEMSAFVRLCEGKKMLLDIGASHGIFTLTFLAKNPGARVFAIEPSPKGLYFLRLNKKLNPGFDIEVLPFALGDKPDKQYMHFEWHHLVTNHKTSQKGILVEYKTLDTLIAEYGMNPDIIKIDVEGFECKVLLGGKRYLREHDPLIILELHGDWMKRYGNDISDLTALLTDCGYKFYDLNNNEISSAASDTLSEFGYKLVCSKSPLN